MLDENISRTYMKDTTRGIAVDLAGVLLCTCYHLFREPRIRRYQWLNPDPFSPARVARCSSRLWGARGASDEKGSCGSPKDAGHRSIGATMLYIAAAREQPGG